MRSEPLEIVRHELSNGLRLLLWPNQQLPLVTILGVIQAGADHNPKNRAGLASMTARLLEEGTVNFPADKLLAAVENVGSQLSSFSQREISGLALTCAPENLEGSIQLIAEMLRHPVFPPDRFLLERERTLSDVQSLEDEPHLVAGDLLDALIYRGTPLAFPLIGTEESLQRMHRQDLLRFHERNFSPQNCLLVVVGACQPETVVGGVEERFSDWTNPHFRRGKRWSIRRQQEARHFSLGLRKEQLHICLGHLGVRRKNPDFHSLRVLDVILGSGPGFTSRIPRKLRDEQGLAYTAYSDITGSSGLYPGRFMAYVATSPEKKERAIRGLLEEIESISEFGVTEHELQAARNYLTGSFVFEFQSNADVARFLVLGELFDLPEDYPQRFLKDIETVEREEVTRVARLYLDTINYSLVCVGPIEEETEVDLPLRDPD